MLLHLILVGALSNLKKTTEMEKLSGHEKAWAKTLSYTKT